MREALSTELGVQEDRISRLVRALEEAFPDALVEAPEELENAALAAPDDRHVTAAALVSRAEIIVTFNVRDFYQEPLARIGIEVQTPDEFLQYLFYLDPDLMQEILREQVADLRSPPQSVGDILRRLRRHVPGIVNAIEERLPPEPNASP